MERNNVQSEFLGCMSAIIVETQEQFEKLKEFMGIKNLFLSDGTPATQLHLTVNKRIAFYRDEIGMFVGYDHPANVGCNYSLKEFNEAFEEQLGLFGDSSTGIVQQPDEALIADDPMAQEPIDTEVKEVENEISLKEVLNQLTIGTITPAKCSGNLLEVKDKVIEIVKKKENIVVTRENFTEIKEVVTDLNAKAKALEEQRAFFNKEVKKFTDPFSKAFTEVINTLKDVSKSIKADIQVFEEEEKEEKTKEFFKAHIMPELMTCFQNESISEKQVNEFKFDEKWLNKDAVTKIGNLTKKTSDAIKAEIQRLINEYTQEKNDIATIESTVKQLAIARGVDGSLNVDTYVELYKKGTPMPAVQERMNQDIAIIKKTVDVAVQKQTQNIQSQQQMQKDNQQVESIQNVTDTKNVTILSDDKTGEVLAKADNQKLMALVVSTPEKHQGKTFEYTYSFSGPFGSIKTFSSVLKLLSMMFKDFKYVERKLEKRRLSDPNTGEVKEYLCTQEVNNNGTK
ncbi:DUF1351 domain-containing protein [Candidatus Stoquefichus massiliensis]|uniref:DUF1351 domain-containing protein n=1 Tax=Candidatus Stoquefichus massiliensis TaxID=1470350 RepID=UPI0004802D11|nr:DUF1351 domain-containing protein [Candidatus Stoquefichus massiliensis]